MYLSIKNGLKLLHVLLLCVMNSHYYSLLDGSEFTCFFMCDIFYVKCCHRLERMVIYRGIGTEGSYQLLIFNVKVNRNGMQQKLNL